MVLVLVCTHSVVETPLPVISSSSCDMLIALLIVNAYSFSIGFKQEAVCNEDNVCEPQKQEFCMLQRKKEKDSNYDGSIILFKYERFLYELNEVNNVKQNYLTWAIEQT